MKKEYRVVKKYFRNGLGRVEHKYEIQFLAERFSLISLSFVPRWKPLKTVEYAFGDSWTETVSFKTEKEAFKYIADLLEPVYEEEVVTLSEKEYIDTPAHQNMVPDIVYVRIMPDRSWEAKGKSTKGEVYGSAFDKIEASQGIQSVFNSMARDKNKTQ